MKFADNINEENKKIDLLIGAIIITNSLLTKLSETKRGILSLKIHILAGF